MLVSDNFTYIYSNFTDNITLFNVTYKPSDRLLDNPDRHFYIMVYGLSVLGACAFLIIKSFSFMAVSNVCFSHLYDEAVGIAD